MKGIYVLIIAIDCDISANIGALGSLELEKGLYAYLGSAQNNLEKRVKRHVGKEKNKFWHIDYLLDNPRVRVLKVLYRRARRSEECKIAQGLRKKGIPVRGFGSSDCHCISHLFKIRAYGFLREHMTETVVGSL